MQKIDYVVQCFVVVEFVPNTFSTCTCTTACCACFFFHLWPLKQPCAGCLDVLRDLLGSENMRIEPSQVSLKPSASLSSIYEAQK